MMFWILGTVIYVAIAVLMFYILSYTDFYNEHLYHPLDFPLATFMSSVFWIVIVPFFIIGFIIAQIAEWIAGWAYVFAEIGRKKDLERRKNKDA